MGKHKPFLTQEGFSFFGIIACRCDLGMSRIGELKDRILAEFPGKMEKESVFIMQFIMKEAQQGKEPPAKAEIESAIAALIKEGVFEKKKALLILKTKSPAPDISEKAEEEDKPIFNPSDYPPVQTQILMAFDQSIYEHKTSLIMRIYMKELQNANKPPQKAELEQAIEALISSGAIEAKGEILIKKI